MRTLSRLLAVATAAPVVAALLASPAAAVPAPCPGGEPVCVFVPATVIPVAVPATGPTTVSEVVVPLLNVCDPAHPTDCPITAKLILPSATLTTTGATFATVNFPGAGIGISATGQPTLYLAAPTVVPGGTGVGVVLEARIHLLPVFVSQDTQAPCRVTPPTTVGPLTYGIDNCYLSLTVTV